MDKKILIGIFVPVLITTTLFIITLTIGGRDGSGTDSSWIPFGTFFVVFILPGILRQQKKRREQMLKKYQLGE